MEAAAKQVYAWGVKAAPGTGNPFSLWKLVYRPLIVFPGVPFLLLLSSLITGVFGVFAAFVYCVVWEEFR